MIIPAVIYFVSILSPSHQPVYANHNSDPNWVPHGFVADEFEWQNPPLPTIQNLSNLSSTEKTRVINQKPYFMVGDDGDSGSNSVGFNKTNLKLDLWIPLAEYNANELIVLETYDLCHGKWDLRASGGKTQVTLIGDHALQAGHSTAGLNNSLRLLDNDESGDGDSVGEDCSNTLTSSPALITDQMQEAVFSKSRIESAISADTGKPITFAAGNSDSTRKVWNPVAWNPDTGLYDGDYVDYISFRIMVRARTLTDDTKYYNMFKMNVRFQSSTSKIYLTYPRAYSSSSSQPVNVHENYNNHGMSFCEHYSPYFFFRRQ